MSAVHCRGGMEDNKDAALAGGQEPLGLHSNRPSSDSEKFSSDLDEDDLELIREHESRVETVDMKSSSKRVIEDSDDEAEQVLLAKKSKTLEQLFSDDDDDGAADESSERDDDLKDFIEDDSDSEQPAERAPDVKARHTAVKPVKNIWGNISKKAWSDLMEIFGDGTEYEHLVWEQSDHSQSDGEKDESREDEHPGVPARLSTMVDGSDIPLAAEWITRNLIRRQLDVPLESVQRVLSCAHAEHYEVPFIATFRKDVNVPLHHLWLIYDLSVHFAQFRRFQGDARSIENSDLIWLKKAKALSSDQYRQVSLKFADNCKAWAPINALAIADDNDELLKSLLMSEALDPLVRKIESLLLVDATVSEAGKRTVGTRHPLAPYVSFRGKPCQAFTKDQFAQVDKAVRAGFTKVDFVIEDRKALFGQVNGLLNGPVAGTLLEGLIGRVCSRMHAKLLKESIDWIGQACQYELQSRMHAQRHSSGQVVVISTQEHVPVVVTLSAESGELLSADRFPEALALQKQPLSLSVKDQAEWSRLLELCGAAKDSVSILAGSTLHITLLHKLLRDADVRAAFAADDVARVQPKFALSLIPSSMPHSLAYRYCLAVGQQYIDPIEAFAALEDAELCKLDLLPELQRLVPQDKLLFYFHRALVNAVNLRGVSIHEAGRGLERFVCGYCPALPGLLKPLQSRPLQIDNVSLSNAIGFMLFPESPHPFDRLKIHPDHYAMVEKMLRDAFIDDPAAESLSDLLGSEKLVERLSLLDLDDYARVLEGEGLKVGEQLKEYRSVLTQPPCKSASRPAIDNERVFWKISGETLATLRPGLMARVRITSSRQGSSWCLGELELSCVPVKVMLGNGNVPIGRIVDSVILSISPQSFMVVDGEPCVRVSIHSDDLSEPKHPIFPTDNYFCKYSVTSEPKKESVAKDSSHPAPKKLPSSIVHHPIFKDQMSRQDAEKLLSGAVAGDAIVRCSPSSGQLVISWRCSSEPGIVQHIPLAVSDDNHIYLQLSNGKRRFEDLDEVIARGIEPQSALLESIYACPKYVKLPSLHNLAAPATDKPYQEHVEQVLQQQLHSNPGRIAYGFWLSRQAPGVAILSIAPRHHEPIVIDVTSSGEYYLFRQRQFKTVSALVDYLKSP